LTAVRRRYWQRRAAQQVLHSLCGRAAQKPRDFRTIRRHRNDACDVGDFHKPLSQRTWRFVADALLGTAYPLWPFQSRAGDTDKRAVAEAKGDDTSVAVD
jgi:hypothetical protein